MEKLNKETGGLEFDFSEKDAKCGLVFEETDDAEAINAHEQPAPTVNEEPPKAELAEKARESTSDTAKPLERGVDDEEFIIPDNFEMTESSVSTVNNYVSTIWKTYVPRFTEVTANHNYIANNSLNTKKEEVAAPTLPEETKPIESASPKKVSVTVEERGEVSDENEDDPTAEVDRDVSDAVVIGVGSKTHESEKNGVMSVFKFPEEHEGAKREEESEEERTRRTITELTGHKWDTPKEEPISDGKPTESPSDVSGTDESDTTVKDERKFSTAGWSDTVPNAERMSEVYSSDGDKKETDSPKSVSDKKVSASDTYEYNSFAMRDVFKDRFLDTIMAAKLRLIIAVIFGAIALAFENLYIFGISLFGSTVISTAAVDASIIAALFMIALPETVRGFKQFARGIFAPELYTAVATLALFGYTAAMAFIAADGVSYPLFGFVAAILTVNGAYATLCMHSADFGAFKMISDKGIKHAYDTRLTRELERENMALDGAIDEYKSRMARSYDTGFVSDFVKNSARRYENTKNNAIVFALILGIAVVSGAVMLFIGEDGAVSGLSTFALVVALATPAFAILSHKLAFRNAECEANSEKGAIIGERTLYEYAGVDVVAFEDTEVFGTEDVSFKSISLADKRSDFNHAMRKMSSLFSALGGPLSDVFYQSLGKKYPAAENVIIEDDGAEGTIDGKQVLAGSADYMLRHGVNMPLRNESSVGSTRIMYAAEDGELFARFAVSYAFSEEFALMLAAMRERGIVPLIYTRDFNINNEFLRFLTSGADVIRVMRRRAPLQPTEVFSKLGATLVTTGDKTSFVSMLLTARKYVAHQARFAFTEILAASVGATLAVVIALCNMTASLPSLLLGSWQLIWTVALAIISAKTFNKQDKDNSK